MRRVFFVVGLVIAACCSLFVLKEFKAKKVAIDRLYIFAIKQECEKLWHLVQAIEKDSSLMTRDLKTVFTERGVSLLQHDKGKFHVLITSIGPLNAVFALTRVMGMSNIHRVINIGFVGAIKYPVGTLVIVNRCKDLGYYVPDSLKSHHNIVPIDIRGEFVDVLHKIFPEAKRGVLGSSGRFLESEGDYMLLNKTVDIVDMEGFYLAALLPDRMSMVKVVTDNLQSSGYLEAITLP